MKIFITGVTGYIGSHTAVELIEAGHEVVGLDNFSNSKPNVLKNISKITGKDITFYEGDMIDTDILRKIFKENKIDVVMDFAAYKAVGDSTVKPVEYYINNVSTVLNLVTAMKEFDIKSLVFSSTATVYGEKNPIPYVETMKTGDTTNPYATSKLFVEKVLEDLYASDNSFNIMIFRYFNPVGAHDSTLLGEDPEGIPANLMPFIAKVATGELECLNVFGDDYDTKDGTGVRDYLHIMDLAKAHVCALEKLEKEKSGYFVYNLGTGNGLSVMDIISSFEKVNNLKLNYKFAPRRAGDIAEFYANCDKARNELNWEAKYDVDKMCKSAYEFIINSDKN